MRKLGVATVLTVYGIETPIAQDPLILSPLQQFLPFTVLKPVVLCRSLHLIMVATVLTVYGIETLPVALSIAITFRLSCNSFYRLRY